MKVPLNVSNLQVGQEKNEDKKDNKSFRAYPRSRLLFPWLFVSCLETPSSICNVLPPYKAGGASIPDTTRKIGCTIITVNIGYPMTLHWYVWHMHSNFFVCRLSFKFISHDWSFEFWNHIEKVHCYAVGHSWSARTRWPMHGNVPSILLSPILSSSRSSPSIQRRRSSSCS